MPAAEGEHTTQSCLCGGYRLSEVSHPYATRGTDEGRPRTKDAVYGRGLVPRGLAAASTYGHHRDWRRRSANSAAARLQLRQGDLENQAYSSGAVLSRTCARRAPTSEASRTFALPATRSSPSPPSQLVIVRPPHPHKTSVDGGLSRLTCAHSVCARVMQHAPPCTPMPKETLPKPASPPISISTSATLAAAATVNEVPWATETPPRCVAIGDLLRSKASSGMGALHSRCCALS